MLALLLLAGGAEAFEFALVDRRQLWSFLDTSTAPADWADPAYDASGWRVGLGAFGYGAPGISTVLDYGPDPGNKRMTAWIRRDFTVVGSGFITGLVAELRVDDGAAVYLNGNEVLRTNLPAGTLLSTTPALESVVGSAGYDYNRFLLDAADLVEGTNTVAVEVHQDTSSSSDLAIDLALLAYDGPTSVVRGPYLQQPTPSSVVVRWRTQGPSDAVVWTGSSPGSLTQVHSDPTFGLDHEVRVTGLTPGSTVYYAIGSTSGVLEGDDVDHVFTTPPAVGTRQPVRIWALGDSGTSDSNAASVRDAYLAAYPTPDVWLMLGDNAYDSGTDDEYQEAVFDFFPDTLRQAPLWSCYGNHDGYSASALTQEGPYFDVFTFPTLGEAGGAPSGSEAYYSFDYANIHFISLDSYQSDRLPGGAMLTWLEADLAQASADWVIAFFHHPAYSKGSHDSDRELGLIEMREHSVPLLEAYGVDLVLSGHSHTYERSMLVDGHYGDSDTLLQSMILDDSDGTRDDGFGYRKPSVGMSGHEGSVYVVAGSSGQLSGGSLDHPIMHVSLRELGSLVIDIDGDDLDLSFLRSSGTIGDTFGITKGVTSIVSLDGPRQGFENELLTWTAMAVEADGTEVPTYTWTFDDGAPAVSGPVASRSWPVQATHTITLTVTDGGGADVVRTFDVSVDNAPPVIDPVVVPPATEGANVRLEATATDPTGENVTFEWDLGSWTITGPAIDVAWPEDGVYIVRLTATDDRGGYSTEDVIVVVDNVAPTVTNVTWGVAEEGSPTLVAAAITDPGVQDTVTVEWDVDGALYSGLSMTHTFPDDGPWPIVITATDDDGGVGTHSFDLPVDNVPPTASLVLAPVAADEGEAALFLGEGADVGDDTLTFTWDFGDGAGAVGPAVTHAWGNDGAYTVELTVDDGDGGATVVSHVVGVANLPPSVDMILSSGSAVEGASVALAASATDPGYSDPLTIHWDFGDGSSADGASVHHVYEQDGAYIATVSVSDDQAQGSSTSAPVFVANAPPEILNLPDRLEVRALQQWSWEPEVFDPGGDPVELQVSGPRGARLEDGVVVWRPDGSDVESTAWFVLTATDDAGAEDSVTWPVAVRPEGLHDAVRADGACTGCVTPGGGAGAAWLVALALVVRRRRVAACLAVAACGPAEVSDDPAPVMVVEPPALDFGTVPGGAPVLGTVTVRNTGGAPLHAELSVEGSASFALESAAAVEVGAGASAAVQIAYTAAGDDVGALLVRGDDPDRPAVEVALMGALEDVLDTDRVDTGGGHTGDTARPQLEYDCAQVPSAIGGTAPVTGALGSHDLEFDDAGRMLGLSAGPNPDLVAWDSVGGLEPIVPSLGIVHQMVRLHDGDLAAASERDGIVRISDGGAVTVINGSIYAYGLALGPNGLLYAADQDAVHRVVPETGLSGPLEHTGTLPDGGPRVLAFNLAYDTLYLGTYLGSGGRIYAVPLDASQTPTGPAVEHASGVGTGAYHDAMGVDLCGNLYVPDYDTRALWRVTPSGAVQLLWQPTDERYPHGLSWGQEGWQDHALFVAQPYNGNTVEQVDVGVPPRGWPLGYAINLPE